jgi:serine/threonine protein kinase
LYELLVGAPVFREGERPDEIREKKRSGFVPVIKSRVSPSMSDLIQTCLRFDPDGRPSFDDIFTFCQDIDFEIVSGADNKAVHEYVRGVIEWELSYPL